MTADVRLPKHYQVRTELEHILSALNEGDPVPPERDLAERFAVSRETVRQALHELLVEGRIERRGRGTVVAAPKLLQPLSLRSYTEGAQSQGEHRGGYWSPGRTSPATPTCAGTSESAAGRR